MSPLTICLIIISILLTITTIVFVIAAMYFLLKEHNSELFSQIIECTLIIIIFGGVTCLSALVNSIRLDTAKHYSTTNFTYNYQNFNEKVTISFIDEYGREQEIEPKTIFFSKPIPTQIGDKNEFSYMIVQDGERPCYCESITITQEVADKLKCTEDKKISITIPEMP